MKVIDKFLTGDPVRIERFTRKWHSVNVHPSIFFRKLDQIDQGYKNSKNLYTELDMGQYISIRFIDKDDLTGFYRMHHEYI